jgi:asparagine synthase (glutamine-hydrolysing)
VEFETLHGLKFKICPAFPMLDIRLMEFVLALPTEEKMQPGKYRLLYRRAMQGLMPEKVVARITKHLPPMISPAQIKWLSTRDSTKNWILDLQKKKQIPHFINTEKLMQWYAEPTDNGVFPNNWSPAIRKQIELIIRWFETRD